MPELISLVLQGLRGGLALPSCSDLAVWPDLEASALRALDLNASLRVPIILQADDPFIMASSKGALQQMLDFIAEWAYKHKVLFTRGGTKMWFFVRIVTI